MLGNQGYGVITGGYFGVSPPEGSPLGALAFLDLNDFDTMMRISVTIGCIHIAIANAQISYRAKSTSGRLGPIGWILALFGGLFIWLGANLPVLSWFGWLGLVGGLAVVAVFASDRQITDLKTGILRAVDGVSALTGVSKLFGDVLSYMRLFALGLSGASLALTFNQLAGQVNDAVPGLGLFLAILILLLGHLMNIGLCIMSGMVHGLRLNFLEFFNWGIPEEGYLFRSFAKKELDS